MNRRQVALRLIAVVAVAAAALLSAGTALADPPLGNNTVKSIKPAAQSGALFRLPADSTPDPTGTVFYFTASGGPHGPGVYRVLAAGGTITALAEGAPFVSPRGIAISSDGQTLFVADPQAMGGVIFALPSSGGAPLPLPGSPGTAARNLTVAHEGAADVIYFSGIDPGNSQPGVFRIAAAGGSLAVQAEGAPLSAPDGVAAAANGDLYFADGGTSAVYRLRGGNLTAIATNVRLLDTAGLALVAGDAVLAVSARHGGAGKAAVLLIDTATLETGLVTKVVSSNNGGGGLHRAMGADLISWCGVQSGSDGTVFRVTLH